MLFETIATTGHEQVVFCQSKDAGLKAIIAIHNTVLGPALGGLRMWPYKTDEEALNDVLRLSRGMTYKNAVAGLNLGGGKAVIIGDPSKDKSEALFRSLGRFINSLHGRYITAEDVGIDVNDMEYVYRETEFAAGSSAPVTIGPLHIDTVTRKVSRDGTQLHLTPIEWQILATLLASAGRTLTHQQIFDAVWGRQFGSPQQYLRVHITNLRRKIEVDPAAPQIIITEPGVGYRAEVSR